MIDSTEHHVSSHFSSEVFNLIDPQQAERSTVEKQIYSNATLTQMNQSLIQQECQKCESEEESCEFRKQKTFFCHPDDEINSDFCFQNFIPQHEEFEQNPEKNSAKKPFYSGFNKSEFFTTQTLIDFSQSPRKREDSIKFMYQIQENTLLNSTETDNEKITQSEQMIEEFDRQQLESEGKTSLAFLQSIKPRRNQVQQKESKIPIGQQAEDLKPFYGRRSILREIQQKIKNQKKSVPVKRARFNLKQFNLKKISHQVSPSKKLETEELVQMILDKVHSQNTSKIHQQNLQTQKLVEILTLAIIPQFQRLENEYKGEMEKIQEKIQQITRANSQNNLRGSFKGKNAQKMMPLLDKQSVIRINLNEDFDMNQYQNDYLRESGILNLIEEESNDDFQRTEDELIVPTIKRTDSEDQLFISCRSEKSESENLRNSFKQGKKA